MEKTKKSFWRRGLALVLALSLVAGTFMLMPTKAADTAVLGGLVDYFQANSSIFNLSSTSRFFFTAEPTGELLQTVQLVQRQFAADNLPSATPMNIVWGTEDMVKSGDIWVKLVDKNAAPAGVTSDEGYHIEVGRYAVVTAYGVDGLLYGLNTLQKHFRNAGSRDLKGFTTYDTPDTKERTVQLDCARKYLTVEYVCNFIKEASWMGYNTLQLHVSEDGGFRADFWDPAYYVKGHYEPENDLSWVCGSHVQSWVQDETDVSLPNYRNDPDKNKYLTTAQLIEIINTCKEYHIDIVPSFDSPAHMDYLNWKFEQNYKSNTSYSFTYKGTTYKASSTSGCINYSGTTGGASPTWPNYTTMDIRDTTRGQMSQAFVKTIYENMADFFKYYAGSEYFVIGGDEPNLFNNAIKANAWRYSLFPGYINEIDDILTAKGYTTRLFNDFVNATTLSKLNDDIQILYWNTPYNSINGTAGAYTVNYINDSGSYTEAPMVTASQYISDGRTMFNCVNLHTYYVLRVAPNGKGGSGGGLNPSHGDARSTKCYQWEFYAADEESIYNKWTPNNLSKKGLYSEPDTICPTEQFGGAYFLTWHDYAAVSTETAMWNGVKDTVNKNGQTYKVRDRMWSNIIKQWNWDINNSLSYANFASIRNTLGDFPGLKSDTYSHASYAKATTLPAATAPIKLGDHASLTAELAKGKISQSFYSDESYAVYLAAYNHAVEVNNNNSASDVQLGEALTRLVNAINGLTVKTHKLTIYYKAIVNGAETTIKTNVKRISTQENVFNIYLPVLDGYSFLRVDNANFTPSDSGDGSGYLTGSITEDIDVTIWYDNNIDTSRLNALIVESYSSKTIGNTSFTDESWNAYISALNSAKYFNADVSAKQSDVDALIADLERTMTALVTPASKPYMELAFISKDFDSAKEWQMGLHLKTSPNIKSITIRNDSLNVIEPATYCSGEVQVMADGTVEKYWTVFCLRNYPEGSSTVTYEIIATYTVNGVDKTISIFI